MQKIFSIAEVQTLVICCNSANKSCLLQVVHTKAITALTQFCDFFNCSLTYILGRWLLKTLRIFSPICEVDILKLNVSNNSALIWTIATTLQFCWTRRVSRKAADPTSFQALIKAKLMVMKDTRHNELADETLMMIRQVNF